MADLVLTAPYFELNSVAYSGQVRSITIPHGAELLDGTRGGDTARRNVGGLKVWNVTVEVVQDFDDTKIDGDIFPLIGTTVTFKIRPSTAAVGVNNPELSGSVVVESYPPIGQRIGELVESTLQLASAGTLSRAEA